MHEHIIKLDKILLYMENVLESDKIMDPIPSSTMTLLEHVYEAKKTVNKLFLYEANRKDVSNV